MKRLKKLQKIGSAFVGASFLLFFIGIIITIGSFGNIECAIETGTMLSQSDEFFNYILSFVGLVITIISVWCINVSTQYLEGIEISINKKRRGGRL